MKKLLVVLIVFMSFSATYKAEAQAYESISFNTFYNELSPYGRWIHYPGYGQVWIADQQGFEPYYDNGHWVFTSYGWTWVSDYSWGWAPFHYGRWAYTSYGWAWVPGYQWAPAWVSWCQNDGYYGWAPLSPGVGFNAPFNSIPRNRWRFVQHQHITSPAIRNYYIRPERNANVYRNVTIINNTQVINNSRYVAGPKREDVERVIRQKIEPKQVAFNETNTTTQVEKSEVRIYRPGIKPNPATEKTEAVNTLQAKDPQVVPLQNSNQNDPLVKPQSPLTEQQKTERVEAVRRQKEEQLKQTHPQQPVRQPAIDQKENDNLQLPVQQNVQRQDVVKQKILQQQEQAREQKIQEQKNQQQIDLQRQQQTRDQRIQAQREQQKASEQQALQRQNEVRLQQMKQQELVRQQRIQERSVQQQQAAQQQRSQQQNELRQQRMERQQTQQQYPQATPERRPQLQKERTKPPL